MTSWKQAMNSSLLVLRAKDSLGDLAWQYKQYKRAIEELTRE